jgi:hypothetical protein
MVSSVRRRWYLAVELSGAEIVQQMLSSPLVDDTEVTGYQSASYPIQVRSLRRCPESYQAIARVPSVDGSAIMIVNKEKLN